MVVLAVMMAVVVYTGGGGGGVYCQVYIFRIYFQAIQRNYTELKLYAQITPEHISTLIFVV